MFGLHNYNGSCWVNAALQSLFRIPVAQARYTEGKEDTTNAIDVALSKIWRSNGTSGLPEFFQAVRTDTMPAGRGIGDSHELLQYLCDKLPFLDELCRFKIANVMKCKSCNSSNTTQDSIIEFPFDSNGSSDTLSDCIVKTVRPYTIDDWECESCKNKGGTRQQLIGTFPKCMLFHAPIGKNKIEYSSILILNKRRYALSSVVCYNGSHWWTYGRNMPPGSSWYVLDDEKVQAHGPKQFPVSSHMRLLIYYRLDE